MQRQSKGIEVKIPPNLLKNFNVYEILEPQKNGANSDVTTVDKLIDIDDSSRDSGFQDSDLHPSFFDINRDCDVIDCFQNIFVTPQHIKKTEASYDVETTETTSSDSNVIDASFKHSNLSDADFKQFFDVLESDQKVDWTNIKQPEEETITKNYFFEKKPKVLVPKVFTDPDPDLVYEVLAQKNMEKMVRESLKVQTSELKERENPEIHKSDVVPELSRFYSASGIAKGSINTGIDNKIPRPSETYMTNNSSTKFIVRAIQKDEKVYKKKCVKKPESQTANFTKGPDFDEKEIVLPQIMARLDGRLAYLHERQNQKKRLILDTSFKPETVDDTTNANSEVKSKNQVSTNIPKPKAQVIPTKKEIPNKLPHIASSSGIGSINFNNMKIQAEAQLCINKISKDIRVHTTDRLCLNCGKAPANKVENHVATSSRTDYGKLAPVVLMEDCNRERLRALKQSQMFKNFVLNGKFDSYIYE